MNMSDAITLVDDFKSDLDVVKKQLRGGELTSAVRGLETLSRDLLQLASDLKLEIALGQAAMNPVLHTDNLKGMKRR